MTGSDHRAGDTRTAHDHAGHRVADNRGGKPAGEPSRHTGHHAHMVADFRRRFWVSLLLSLPVLALAPLIQRFLGLEEAFAFPGDRWVQFAAASGSTSTVDGRS